MQVVVPGSRTEHRPDFQLRYPQLSIEDQVSSWLETTPPPPPTMASLADDSSVDDNVSSIGDSTWDIIDEGSARSDEEDQRIQRSTFPVEEVGNEQSALTSATAEKEAEPRQHGGDIRLGYDEVPMDAHSELDEVGSSASLQQGAEMSENMEPPSTAGLQNLQEPDGEDTSHVREEDVGTLHKLKFEVPTTTLTDETVVEVSKVMAWPESLQLQECHTEAAQSEPLIQKIRQQMSTRNLVLDKPYRVMYLGPPEVKQRIIHKIGSALFESIPQAAGSSDMDSSRVTVVPLSAFGPDREVALLASVGLDISIEEWASVSKAVDALGKSPLQVLVNNRKIVQSSWNARQSKYELSHGYDQPDLAIIFMPANATIEQRESRYVIHTFLRRHGIPTLLISSSTDGRTHAMHWPMDARTPHFSVETTKSRQVILSLPIDLDTFLDIDALQMNRNLACLKPATPAAVPSSSTSMALPFRRDVEKAVRFIRSQPWSVPPIKILAMALLLLVAAKYWMASNEASLAAHDQARALSPHPPMTNHAGAPSMATTNTHAAATPSEATCPRPIARTDLPSTRHKDADLAALLPDAMLLPNRSDKFMVHVIGDCHVIMRPPRWFAAMRKAPSLKFRVTRQQKPLDYDFSAPFDGVYVLKVPRDDAHGLVTISVWTAKKPKINETFQVDFGSPWLRTAGWQAAAQVVSEQVKEEFHSAHAYLFQAYTHTSEGVQTFLKDAAQAAESVVKEVEKIGSASLDQTMRTTDFMVARSKELSHQLADTLHRHRGLAADPLAHLKQAKLREDLAAYTRQISRVLTEQAEALTQAATGLNVRALAHEVQAYREKNLQEAQVKALHMWWKVRGGPPPQSRKLKREKRKAKRCRGKWNRK